MTYAEDAERDLEIEAFFSEHIFHVDERDLEHGSCGDARTIEREIRTMLKAGGLT